MYHRRSYYHLQREGLVRHFVWAYTYVFWYISYLTDVLPPWTHLISFQQHPPSIPYIYPPTGSSTMYLEQPSWIHYTHHLIHQRYHPGDTNVASFYQESSGMLPPKAYSIMQPNKARQIRIKTHTIQLLYFLPLMLKSTWLSSNYPNQKWDVWCHHPSSAWYIIQSIGHRYIHTNRK